MSSRPKVKLNIILSLLFVEVELMETRRGQYSCLNSNAPSKSLLFVEVELMETIQVLLQSRMDVLQSLLFVEVELMETHTN